MVVKSAFPNLKQQYVQTQAKQYHNGVDYFLKEFSIFLSSCTLKKICLHLLLYDSENALLNFYKIRIRFQKICQPVVIVATFVENFTEWKWHMFDNGPWVGTKALNVDSAQWGLFYSIPFLEFLLWLPLIVFHSLKHFTKTKLTGWSKT